MNKSWEDRLHNSWSPAGRGAGLVRPPSRKELFRELLVTEAEQTNVSLQKPQRSQSNTNTPHDKFPFGARKQLNG